MKDPRVQEIKGDMAETSSLSTVPFIQRQQSVQDFDNLHLALQKLSHKISHFLKEEVKPVRTHSSDRSLNQSFKKSESYLSMHKVKKRPRYKKSCFLKKLSQLALTDT